MTVSRSWFVPYSVVVALWGSSYAVTEVALTAFSPVGLAMWRALIGAAFLAAVLLARRSLWPRVDRRSVARMGLLALLTTVGNVSAVSAQSRMPSGMVAVLCAMTPLFSVIVFQLRRKRSPPSTWIGVCMGVVGVLVLVSPGGMLNHVGVLMGLMTAAFFSAAGILSADFFADSSFSGIQLTTAQLFISGLLLAALTGLTDISPSRAQLGPVLALVVLGVFAAGVGNVFFWKTLRLGGPVLTATTHQTVPLVAVTIGALVLGEPMKLGQLIGAALVLGGLALLLPQLREIEDADKRRVEEGVLGVHCEEMCVCPDLADGARHRPRRG